MFPMMAEPIRILTVELEDGDGLVVTFSDRTTAGYVVEELLELRPHREPTERAAQALTRSTELAGPEQGVDCKP
jgi:hypothetical protein